MSLVGNGFSPRLHDGQFILHLSQFIQEKTRAAETQASGFFLCRFYGVCDIVIGLQ